MLPFQFGSGDRIGREGPLGRHESGQWTDMYPEVQ